HPFQTGRGGGPMAEPPAPSIGDSQLGCAGAKLIPQNLVTEMERSSRPLSVAGGTWRHGRNGLLNWKTKRAVCYRPPSRLAQRPGGFLCRESLRASAEVGQGALDPVVSPGGILPGHPQDQFSDLGCDGWPPSLLWPGPAPALIWNVREVCVLRDGRI